MEPRSWITVSRSAVRHNIRVTKRIAGPNVSLLPILKANAYGHGYDVMLRALRGENIWGIGVAYGHEAFTLRAQGYSGRVIVLSYWHPSELKQLVRQSVDIAVWDFPSLRSVQTLQPRVRSAARLHLKLDTGTTRLGFLSADIATLRTKLKRTPVNIVGLFSHLANSEEPSPRRTAQQLTHFTTLGQRLGLGAGSVRHIACTAAGLRYPEARFGLLRLGIGLYGIWPSEATRHAVINKKTATGLRPVGTWMTRVSQVKVVPVGTAIGYGSTYTTKRRSTIALLPVGYADGYDRRLSNCGWVMIRGQRAPVRGRVCMNVMMVDVTQIHGVRVGDPVTLIGPGISVTTMASLCGTIAYEIIARLSSDLPRYLRS